MKRIVKVSSLFLLIALTSCFDNEVYSDIPKVEFESLRFYNIATGPDSLILSFNFEDGDSNFGIVADDDFFPPYNEFNFYLNENDSLITADNYNSIELPIYKVPVSLKNLTFTGFSDTTIFFAIGGDSYPIFGFNRDTITDLADIPPFECPNISNQSGSLDDISFQLYDFINNTIESKSVQVESSVLVERLDTHFNLIIEFEERIGIGEYMPLDFQERLGTNDCDIGVFSAQVPIFDSNGESGKISYRMNTLGFVSAFLDNEIRISFYIIDRSFNRSNTESFEFRLADITQ